MRLTRQIVALLCLCVMGAVFVVLLTGAFSLHTLTERYQRDELRALVRIFEQDVLMSPQAPRLSAWLPPMLQANGVKELTIRLDDAPLFHYREPGFTDSEYRLQTVLMAGEFYPGLHLRFEVLPALTMLSNQLSPLRTLALGVGTVVVGVWLALLWLRRQLRGVELLAQRGQHILSGNPGKLRHDVALEWPPVVSAALTYLQDGLEDSKKERSRFDTFIRRNVFIDKQLGIGNRIFFDNRVEAALSDAEYSAGAMLLLSIDGLELLKKEHGEGTAQSLLLQASELTASFTQRFSGAVQARYARDTLALLLPNISKQETLTAAEQLWRQLLRLDWPAPLDPERQLFIGAVCYQPGEWLAQIEEEAEMALRGARLQREGGFFLYDKVLRVEANGKGSVRWRTLLERQFARGQLTYQIQSAWSCQPAEPVLHELLARLPDGRGKLLPAASFVTMVEKVGMQRELDRLMLGNALALLPTERSVPLALNLHPQSLLDNAFRHQLLMALLRIGKRRASRLVIELNEALVSRYQEGLRAPLRELRLLGCQLAVDHAGQDVVSTHYIKEFELSYLKIHPSLVRDIASRPLNQMAVRSLVGGCLGQTQVIAVGIQNEQEWQVLQSLGVSGGQGFWLDQAMQGDKRVLIAPRG